MSYSELVLKDYADILWPLDDITQSSSISYPVNFLVPSTSAFTASVNTGYTNVEFSPIIFGGGTALQFTSSAVGLSIPAQGRFSNEYKDKNSTLSFWIKINNINIQEQPILKRRGSDNVGLFIKENYLLFKYGNSASYSLCVGDITNLDEPHHVMISAADGIRLLSIDGQFYQPIQSFDTNPDFDSDINNDVIDFYGPIDGSWEIDCPAFYSYTLSSFATKRHYVYGVGKWVPDDIFYARGGSLFNFSTISTRKLLELSWDYPSEWRFTDYKDLRASDLGLQSIQLTSPSLRTFDNILDKSNDSIKFSTSGSVTKTSYVEVGNFSEKVLDGSYPVFIKYTLDGELPGDENYQTLAVYGELPEDPYLTVDLYNNSGTYQVKFSAVDYNESITFDIQDISSSPQIYIGFRFLGSSEFYFSQTGSAIQTASFSYADAEGFGQDPLLLYFPPRPDSLLRMGGTLTYDLSTSTPTAPLDFYQFKGTFNKMYVMQNDDIDSQSTYSDLDSYRKTRYAIQYLTDEERFKVSTYGTANWNLHAIDISEYIDDETLKVGSSIVEIGYPFLDSASQVSINVTHLSYSGSVLYPQTSLVQKNYLSFINNKNIFNSYLKFDLDIYTDDLYYYPPKIKYFRFESYRTASVGTVPIKDDAGFDYILYPTSSSQVYLPETKLTPTIFLRNDSGIKLQDTFVDFVDNITAEPLDPRTIDGLRLWLDARFPRGLRRDPYQDDARVESWTDLSDFSYNAISNSASSSPVYRRQSLNLLRVNQLSGSEENDLSHISVNAGTIESSNYGVISGTQAISVIPDLTSIDSYIDVSSNTASITVFPNQTYTVVGSIRLDKRQTASALSEFARSIVVYEINSSSTVFSVQSASADNSSGTYSLSAVFTTSASANGAILRFYNGSYNPDDLVYWDDLGLYHVSSSIVYGSGGSSSVSMPISSWKPPLTENDHAVIKFDGINSFLETSASATQPYTLYVVGRAFNDGVFIGNTASGASLYSYDGNYYFSTGSANAQVTSDSDFNIYTIIVSSASAKLWLNGLAYYTLYSGEQDIEGMIIGKGTLLNDSENYLSGDIAAILLYQGAHDQTSRSAVESWLDESFNLLNNVIGVSALDDVYYEQYTSRYPPPPP